MHNVEKGKYYKQLSKVLKVEDLGLLKYYIENYEKDNNLEKAYSLVKNNPANLTMFFLKEYGVFKLEPLHHFEYVPEKYLYEIKDESIVIYLHPGIKEIRDNAFRYCSIKKLIISKEIEKIGDSALCLNSGEIEYEGTKQEFIDKFLGKSKCFLGTSGQQIICSDGILQIKR